MIIRIIWAILKIAGIVLIVLTYEIKRIIQSIHSILKQYWGYDSFRPLQEEIIRSILAGKDTLALLPTGGGKSICFQVPAMAMDGLCLVISPLIALMKDQVENLRKRKITAFAIYSGLTRKEVMDVLHVASNSNCKFLYVSPERLETKLFHEYLPSLGVKLIAVDEAHCISQWGYDFRPPYLRISALREELPKVPVLAVTASATPVVQKDICEKLSFHKHEVFRQSFERPNLSYSIFSADSKINRITEILRKVQGSGIVYCKSRKRTKEISDLLNMHSVKASFYHAGLSQEMRNDRQEAWINNKIRVVVCTNAFGMGIDKPDVRIVIHADVPDSLENYYQEAGRAGRDGKKAYAVLLYNERELDELRSMPDKRYPKLNEIREVYKALMNFLQLPAGSGEGQFFEFHIGDFLKKTGLESMQVMSALKAIEQEDLLTFNESVFLSSRVQFICTKQRLYEFEESFPDLEPLIKSLLRTYEGIYDQPVSISEKTLAYLLKSEAKLVETGLQNLHQYKIIHLEPLKDSPQLFFTQNRVKVEELVINEARYRERKQSYINRINAILNFIHSVSCCSQTIGIYFGDESIGECGICHNCINRKKQPLTTKEFDEIYGKLVEMIGAQSHSPTSLIQSLSHIQKKKLMEVLNFMQSEKRVLLNEKGIMVLQR